MALENSNEDFKQRKSDKQFILSLENSKSGKILTLSTYLMDLKHRLRNIDRTHGGVK